MLKLADKIVNEELSVRQAEAAAALLAGASPKPKSAKPAAGGRQGQLNEIAERLGFRREAITLALGRLTMMGYIDSRRGEIAVASREGLEAMVCDCYWLGQEKPKPELREVGKAFLRGATADRGFQRTGSPVA